MEYIRYLGWLEKFRPRISQEYLAADPAEKIPFGWPGISKDIKIKVAKCEECLKRQANNKREEMLVPDLPTRPWQKIGSDLYSYGNRDYVIITDYYSFYPEVYQLPSQESRDVIKAMKDAFFSSWCS